MHSAESNFKKAGSGVGNPLTFKITIHLGPRASADDTVNFQLMVFLEWFDGLGGLAADFSINLAVIISGLLQGLLNILRRCRDADGPFILGIGYRASPAGRRRRRTLRGTGQTV